jgi:Fe-S-cluster containining protein
VEGERVIETELEALCASCGMCCDGSLFGRVMFEPDELAPKKRLTLIASGRGFDQPCSALTEQRTCSIYEERPRACRRFVCRLYDRHRTEGGPLEARIAIVTRVRTLLADVDALSSEERAELARMIEDFAWPP